MNVLGKRKGKTSLGNNLSNARNSGDRTHLLAPSTAMLPSPEMAPETSHVNTFYFHDYMAVVLLAEASFSVNPRPLQAGVC